MAARRANGEGSVYRRKDGRYVAAAIVMVTSGGRKRVSAYGRTRVEASEKLSRLIARGSAGLPTADRAIKLAVYLDYWLDNFVKLNLRPKTYEQYECAARLYLKPALGSRDIKSLSTWNGASSASGSSCNA